MYKSARIVEGRARFGDYQTWYRNAGDQASGLTPLIVAHGGPSLTWDCMESYAALAESGRPVIHCDQTGNCHSTRLPEKGAEFWTVDLFLDELRNLIDHLGLTRFYMLGQSWGGMMGAEFAMTRPAGLKALVLANSPASMALWIAETELLRADLPPEVRAVLDRHESAGTTDHAEYRTALEAFNARHVCRLNLLPDGVQSTNRALEADAHVYNLMIGPNGFHITGTLKDWDLSDRLHQINVPTLLISGAHDEATPATVRPFDDLIPVSRWRIFPQSSHMPHVEEFEACMAEVGAFLAECDARC